MKYIRDIEAWNKLDSFLNNHMEGDKKSSISLHVRGEGGVGKSTFLKKVAEAYQKKDASVYIEVSACTNEVEILKLLADQLHGLDEERFGFKKFLFIYDWFYGEYSLKPKVGLDEEEKLRNIWDAKFKQNLVNSGEDVFEMLAKIIFTGEFFTPFSAGIKIIKQIVKTVKGLEKENSELDKLCNISERAESERSRRKLLKELFIEEYEDGVSGSPLRMVIIIDNFCLQAGGTLGRDLEWLTGETGLLKNIPAAWIIGSRMAFELNLDHNIILKGFEYDPAKLCIESECTFTEQEEQNHLSVRMLELAEEMNGDKVFYLPYKLNIIVDHYWKLKDKRGTRTELTIDDFQTVNGELVSEYFYMDLPEYRVNAAQILSCMDTWNERRLDIVRKKFNDLLLNAKHLLQSNISIEEIGNGNFKLHESTKDALYKNDRNVIKYDVQEFIFTELCDLFSDDNLKESIVRDHKICNMYVTLSLEYLKYISREKSSAHGQMLEKLYRFEELANNERNEVEGTFYMFFRCLKYMYDANKQPDLIDEEFVRFYKEVIDRLKDLINSPRNQLYSSLYVQQRKLLADLYTNISRPDEAQQIERECLKQAERLYQNEKEKAEVTSQLFLAEKLLLDCRNAYAYDQSFSWQYNHAYEEGRKGLCDASDFICIKPGQEKERNRTIIGNILTTIDNCGTQETFKETIDALHLLNQIYIFDEGVDNAIDSKEFPSRDKAIPYEKLVSAYGTILSNGIHCEDLELKKRINALIDIIFSDVNKLRGNFPWYCICEKEEAPDTIISFAIKTYLIRKAQNEALQQKEFAQSYKSYAKNMYSNSLTSYHNLGVYFFRLGRFEEAFEIGVEACFRRMQSLRQFDLKKINNEQNIRYKNVKDKADEHCISAIIKLLDISIMEHLQANDATIESIQYLGNYLLYKKNYKMAIDKLGEAYINRYIRYGMKRSKTLDCGIRLAAALYGSGESKLAISLLEDIYQSARDFLNVGISEKRLKEYKNVKNRVKQGNAIGDILTGLL